ncbi:Uncharacterised protein [Actinobacillus ureae]|nr:Uncharacterised protein [Actinobacillus ureae]
MKKQIFSEQEVTTEQQFVAKQEFEASDDIQIEEEYQEVKAELIVEESLKPSRFLGKSITVCVGIV